LNSLGDVTIRVDASSEIGLGHLRRCVLLARQLRGDGFAVQLIGAQQFGTGIEPLVEDMPVFWLDARECGSKREQNSDNEAWDAQATLSIIGQHPSRVSWVVVDHYRLGERWEKMIHEAGHRVLAIDDFRNRKHCADILVADSATPFDPRLNSCAGKVKMLAGVEFALVDPEFAFSEQSPIPASGGRRVLISYGSADPTDETSKALEAVRLLKQAGHSREWLGAVDVVVGPANMRATQVSARAEGMEGVAVHVAPESLAPFMRTADMFLTAGGNSMIEALTMRKPCLVTQTSENQALMVDQLRVQRAIRVLGNHAIVGPRDVVKAMTKLHSDYEQFSREVRACPLFDHFGARRISAAIQSMSSDDPSIDHHRVTEAMS
jgi:UDP-2,4-diacetamido-2,4,6-trideoxy-beta-L-altropyranose hydrolase